MGLIQSADQKIPNPIIIASNADVIVFCIFEIAISVTQTLFVNYFISGWHEAFLKKEQMIRHDGSRNSSSPEAHDA